MNAQEIKNSIALISVLFGGIFTAHGIDISQAQWSTIATEASVIVPAVISISGTFYSIYSHWNMKKVPEHSIAVARILSSDPALHDEHAIGDHVEVSGQAAKVVGAWLIGFILGGFILFGAVQNAAAQNAFKPKTPTQVFHDVDDAITGTRQKVAVATGTLPACNIALFSALTLDNVFDAVTNCIGKGVADATAPLLRDLTDAQTSATTANDKVALACYQPGLGILNAAKQIPESKDDAGNVIPAHYSGILTVQQKFREFVMSGGIVACKALVNSTAAMATGSAL